MKTQIYNGNSIPSKLTTQRWCKAPWVMKTDLRVKYMQTCGVVHGGANRGRVCTATTGTTISDFLLEVV